jgi:hypothetical protein
MFMVIEIFNAEDLSMKPQDLSYNFTTDALASLKDGDDESEDKRKPTLGYIKSDPTTILLLGSGMIGLAGLARRKTK